MLFIQLTSSRPFRAVELKKVELSSEQKAIQVEEDGSVSPSSYQKDIVSKPSAATDIEKIGFLMNLCQAMLASGQSTVDAEER